MRLTDRQVEMYAEEDATGNGAEREDDWTPFGLRRDGKLLRGPMSSLQAYAEYRKKKEQAAHG